MAIRLLHTADWHLGRAFHGEDLLGSQAAFVDFLVETAREARIDGILVAGDLFDRALPPVDAVRLASSALVRLAEIAPVVVISGNHDSAARLGFGAELLASAGVHLVTDPASIGTPVLLGGALVYPLPYLEPDLVREGLGVEARTHAAVTEAAMRLVRADLRARGIAVPERPAPGDATVAGGPDASGRGARSAGGPPVVVMAHAFVSGAAGSDSERDLAIGGAAHIPPAVFAGADYIALGHLHGPQVVGGGAGRYAGSPLAFSFSEAHQRKSLAIVELDAAGARPRAGAAVSSALPGDAPEAGVEPDGAARTGAGAGAEPDGFVGAGAAARVELIPVPVPRPLATLRGTLDELLADPRLADREGAWVQATLTDPARPGDAMERLRRRFPHAVVLAFDPQGAAGAPGDSYQRLRGLGDEELVRRFVSDVRGSAAEDEELELLHEAMHARRLAEATA